LPVGAYGGSKHLMSHIAPEGPVYQAGTLSGNPVAMAAGLATLRILEREKAWTKLEDMGARLEKAVTAALADVTVPWAFTRVGSIFWLSFQGAVPRSAEALDQTAGERFKPLFHAMLDRGIYLPPSAYEVMFLSLAHTAEDGATLAAALRETVPLTAA
jgi:glutamate-1-semialdehyde 2,1-aminomutase